MVDLHPIPMPDLLRSFREQATSSTSEGVVWLPLARLACIAMSMGPEGKRAFLTLLDDDVEAVRYLAARQALDRGMDMDRPIPVLRAVGRGDSPFWYSARVRLIALDQFGK